MYILLDQKKFRYMLENLSNWRPKRKFTFSVNIALFVQPQN